MIAESAILLVLTAANSFLSIDSITEIEECAYTKNNCVIEEITDKEYLNKNILILQNKNGEVLCYAILDK